MVWIQEIASMENTQDLMTWREAILALFALIEIVLRLTPSENDNSLFNKVVTFATYILDFVIPNRKKSGGKYVYNAPQGTTGKA